jgi:membrane-bound metal-dependent hydrolase YbcI (DUF457 family)
MPFTPFHFGPGALVHAAAPRRVSFVAFCVANVVIDIEPLVWILRGEPPLHRLAHTFIGALAVALVTVALVLAAARLAVALRLPRPWRGSGPTAQRVAIGALLGSVSHVVLDGAMHADVRPFAPWSDANPFLRAVSVDTLHGACVVAALVGVAWTGVRWLRSESLRLERGTASGRDAGRVPR